MVLPDSERGAVPQVCNTSPLSFRAQLPSMTYQGGGAHRASGLPHIMQRQGGTASALPACLHLAACSRQAREPPLGGLWCPTISSVSAQRHDPALRYTVAPDRVGKVISGAPS